MAERYTSPVLDRRVTLVGKRETGDRGDWNQPETEDVEIEVWGESAGRDGQRADRRPQRHDSELARHPLYHPLPSGRGCKLEGDA